MSQYRVYVEKKEPFRTEVKGLKDDLNKALHLSLTNVRIINVYDLFHLNEAELKVAKTNVLADVVTDVVSDTVDLTNTIYFAVRYLPGQYDQQADSAMQCLALLTGNRQVVIKCGKIIILEGDFNLEKVKNYYINEIEMQELDLAEPLSLNTEAVPQPVLTHEGFIDYTPEALAEFLDEQGMAMSIADISMIQDYFKNQEQRNPTETELKVLDTYWSDHCRHTTFETIIKEVTFASGRFHDTLQKTFADYCLMREQVHDNHKNMTLMDMATIVMKEQRKSGRLNDLEVSDEVNACSVYIDVDVDGVLESWLLMFKNETHNHPTEIEPFGGASTCVGGAIRDPLSGRSYIYQAMRISGAADPLEPVADTLEGKLPQRLISQVAAAGNASYGNQIGVPSSFVREIYHEGYKAKHMEAGAVVGAVRAADIKRLKPEPGDAIILLGGRTGRDGVGGATGSSKVQTQSTALTASSEVQKGDAPTERKIQRLFRKAEVTKLIKKCNDFGAGGVSVAIGELADGLNINLDAVPVKYGGLNGTELAISESQERMAVVISPKDITTFIQYAKEENLEATVVAFVTDEGRLTMTWKGKTIVSLSRDFLDTSGATGSINIEVATDMEGNPFICEVPSEASLREKFLSNLTQPNVASQQGMVQMYDATIGAATVLMPYGGKYQLTETEGSVHKIPLRHGTTNTASLLAYGYNPEITSWSPFHGAAYAVVESIARIVALGGKWQGIRFSFQEYFRRLESDPKRWGQPFSALLGAIYAQKGFGLPAIGGKDSMSGTYGDLNVPPTLISFAVQTEKADKIIASEFKKSGHYVYLIKHDRLADLMPNIDQLKRNFNFIHEMITRGHIKAAFTVKQGGIAEAIAKMAFGNKIGAHIKTEICLFEKQIGSIVVESDQPLTFDDAYLLGRTTAEALIVLDQEAIKIDDCIEAWQGRFVDIFPIGIGANKSEVPELLYGKTLIKTSPLKATPQVFIPVFPGTNGEYDSARAFEQAGARTVLDASIQRFANHIGQSQILMLAGGFTTGEEPNSAEKFMTSILMNEQIRDSIEKLLERDGLILGIGSGFRALVKLGLLPFGQFGRTSQSPALVRNDVNYHLSKIVKTRMTGAKSPWLMKTKAGDIHHVAISHLEGKFVANDQLLNQLIENEQIATQYVGLDNKPTMNEIYNPSGSMVAIEGIISPDGKIFGKMGHSERMGENIFKNVPGNYDQKIFLSGVEYYRK